MQPLTPPPSVRPSRSPRKFPANFPVDSPRKFRENSLDSKIEEAKLHRNKRLAAREEIISLAKARDAERDEHKAVEHALQYGLVPKAIDQVGRILSCLVLSRLVLSCLVLSCLVLSCLVLSCLVLSCLVLSCLVLSRVLSRVLRLVCCAASLLAACFLPRQRHRFAHGLL